MINASKYGYTTRFEFQQSKAIAAVECNFETIRRDDVVVPVTIEMKNGGAYDYRLPGVVAFDFVTSSSVGGFYAKCIRGKWVSAKREIPTQPADVAGALRRSIEGGAQ